MGLLLERRMSLKKEPYVLQDVAVDAEEMAR